MGAIVQQVLDSRKPVCLESLLARERLESMETPQVELERSKVKGKAVRTQRGFGGRNVCGFLCEQKQCLCDGLFCTVGNINLMFAASHQLVHVVPSFCHVCHVCHSVILSFCHSVILSFCHSVSHSLILLLPPSLHLSIPSFLPLSTLLLMTQVYRVWVHVAPGRLVSSTHRYSALRSLYDDLCSSVPGYDVSFPSKTL